MEITIYSWIHGQHKNQVWSNTYGWSHPRGRCIMDCRLGVNVQWAKCLNAAKEATNKKIMPCRLTQAHFLAGPEDPATLQLLFWLLLKPAAKEFLTGKGAKEPQVGTWEMWWHLKLIFSSALGSSCCKAPLMP